VSPDEKIEVKVFNFGHTHDIAVLTSEPYEVIFDSTKIGSGDNYILIPTQLNQNPDDLISLLEKVKQAVS